MEARPTCPTCGDMMAAQISQLQAEHDNISYYWHESEKKAFVLENEVLRMRVDLDKKIQEFIDVTGSYAETKDSYALATRQLDRTRASLIECQSALLQSLESSKLFENRMESLIDQTQKRLAAIKKEATMMLSFLLDGWTTETLKRRLQASVMAPDLKAKMETILMRLLLKSNEANKTLVNRKMKEFDDRGSELSHSLDEEASVNKTTKKILRVPRANTPPKEDSDSRHQTNGIASDITKAKRQSRQTRLSVANPEEAQIRGDNENGRNEGRTFQAIDALRKPLTSSVRTGSKLPHQECSYRGRKNSKDGISDCNIKKTIKSSGSWKVEELSTDKLSDLLSHVAEELERRGEAKSFDGTAAEGTKDTRIPKSVAGNPAEFMENSSTTKQSLELLAAIQRFQCRNKEAAIKQLNIDITTSSEMVTTINNLPVDLSSWNSPYEGTVETATEKTAKSIQDSKAVQFRGRTGRTGLAIPVDETVVLHRGRRSAKNMSRTRPKRDASKLANNNDDEVVEAHRQGLEKSRKAIRSNRLEKLVASTPRGTAIPLSSRRNQGDQDHTDNSQHRNQVKKDTSDQAIRFYGQDQSSSQQSKNRQASECTNRQKQNTTKQRTIDSSESKTTSDATDSKRVKVRGDNQQNNENNNNTDASSKPEVQRTGIHRHVTCPNPKTSNNLLKIQIGNISPERPKNSHDVINENQILGDQRTSNGRNELGTKCWPRGGKDDNSIVQTNIGSHPINSNIGSHPTNSNVVSHPANSHVVSHQSNGIVGSHPTNCHVVSHPSNGIVASYPSSGIVGSHPSNGIIGSHPSNGIIGSHQSNGIIGSHPSNGVVGSHPSNGIVGAHPSNNQSLLKSNNALEYYQPGLSMAVFNEDSARKRRSREGINPSLASSPADTGLWKQDTHTMLQSFMGNNPYSNLQHFSSLPGRHSFICSSLGKQNSSSAHRSAADHRHQPFYSSIEFHKSSSFDLCEYDESQLIYPHLARSVEFDYESRLLAASPRTQSSGIMMGNSNNKNGITATGAILKGVNNQNQALLEKNKKFPQQYMPSNDLCSIIPGLAPTLSTYRRSGESSNDKNPLHEMLSPMRFNNNRASLPIATASPMTILWDRPIKNDKSEKQQKKNKETTEVGNEGNLINPLSPKRRSTTTTANIEKISRSTNENRTTGSNNTKSGLTRIRGLDSTNVLTVSNGLPSGGRRRDTNDNVEYSPNFRKRNSTKQESNDDRRGRLSSELINNNRCHSVNNGNISSRT